ncbi:Rpn family recombination-promoting nuclease/putative transposase [Oceanobacillus sojae]|uniref:Rpn family recombination-promoting nuclease/putative transposase n=1 Tax=Oceanobacillus sojae TaxID=582851 RepID=UPI0021A57048|nr:Rpn family recombination-promoting nuclease/putative transposase [Oceanobacillus sojae]MCT1905405.1 Rpn family recombination-promoting nuclease/putative transposase [Oceanobacillus sojae]
MFITPVILEEEADYMKHDRLTKKLIQEFFEEFIEAFFPNLHPHIDFSKVTFLEQEVYLDYINGRKKEIDVLAEVKLNHQDKILHIHTEAQSTREADFPERMFLYFSYLYAKHRKPIQPIAVLSYNRKKDEPTQFKIDSPTQEVLQFNFLQLHLKKKNWREYIQSDNPAVAALLSQMGYEEHERVQVKIEFLRMITRMKINPAKMEFLYGFFETYLKLNKEEEAQMMEEIENLPEEEKEMVLHLPNSYFEKGLEEGKQEGKQEGIAEGRKEGIQKRNQEVALKLIAKGMPINEIAEITELSKEEIKNLADK